MFDKLSVAFLIWLSINDCKANTADPDQTYLVLICLPFNLHFGHITAMLNH